MQTTDLIKIAIADPSAIVRSGLASILKRSVKQKIHAIEIAVSDGLGKILEMNKPDILIINPVFWFQAQHDKQKEFPKLEKMKTVVVVYTFTDETFLKQFDEAISILDTAEDIQAKIATLFDKTPLPTTETAVGNDILSQREKEIVSCVVKGMTNKAIAEQLFLSTHTVITHRRNIARKLEIHSTAGLTVYAIVNKLVELKEVKN